MRKIFLLAICLGFGLTSFAQSQSTAVANKKPTVTEKVVSASEVESTQHSIRTIEHKPATTANPASKSSVSTARTLTNKDVKVVRRKTVKKEHLTKDAD